MSKTALVDAIKRCDVDRVRSILHARPDLKQLQLDRGLNLLQFCCSRATHDDPSAADRQLRLAKWMVAEGFDPRVTHTTAPGEDGEEDPAELSLVFFAVARARNNRLARYFLGQGASPNALFAAVWWGNADIINDLVTHGADINEVVGATPLHMAVAVLDRGTEGKPALARARSKLLKEMLQLGANPNIAAVDGTTPLHTALKKGYDVAVFKLLLQHGANPDVAGKDGRTVREIASRKKDKRYIAAMTRTTVAILFCLTLFASSRALAQEPAKWGPNLEFHTFSIIAVDPRTRETGVAVTTRNPCVGNAVPWVRAGVGAVATQGGTRVEYGPELLDLLAKGVAPQDALDQLVKADVDRERRQVGVINVDGRSAQWTGSGQKGAESRGDWTAERAGPTFAVQGNSLVSPEVVYAVAANFQASEGSSRSLADRLIDALNAGQLLGGDGRHGETQSAAVLVADPRSGMSRRPDGQTVNINVCEHPEPVRELRRIYDTASETLGFRTLEQPIGRDIIQLKMMLHALGYFRPGDQSFDPRAPQANIYTQEAVEAVDRFRAAQGWQTTVPGYVDGRTIAQMWKQLDERGRAEAIRKQLLDLQRVR